MRFRGLVVFSALMLALGCPTWSGDDDAADDDGSDDDGGDDDAGDDDGSDDDGSDDDGSDDDGSDDDGSDDDGGDDDSTGDICDSWPSQVICDGDTAVTCDAAGDVAGTDPCDTGNGFFCSWGTGCILCHPGPPTCLGDDVVECAPDQQSWTVLQACDPWLHQTCFDAGCWDMCAASEQRHSSVGCEFFAVDADQADTTEDVQFAVAMSNVHPVVPASASISLYNGFQWQALWSGNVGPQQLVSVDLMDWHVDDSAYHQYGAFRVVSDIPVAAYQFNPVDGATSYLSDASLLLPVPVWDRSYRLPGWVQAQDNTFADQHGSLNVVALHDDTQVTVTPTCPTLAGAGVPAGSSGVPFQVTLTHAGDVLQVATGADGQSLAGTLVESGPGKPIAVFAGHECALVPTHLCCCDHLEEQVFGVQTWGESYLAARIPHRGPPVEDAVWQIVAGHDPVTLTFSAHADVTGLPGTTQLQPGQELLLEVGGTTAHPGDFEVWGSDAFLLTQYQQSSGASAQPLFGDPSMVQAVPEEQYLDRYVVLVPGTWDNDYLILTRLAGETVTVGGVSVDSWPEWSEIAPIGASGYEAVRLLVGDGTQVLAGSQPFGVVVVGFDQHDSYAYPGGLNQEPINPL